VLLEAGLWALLKLGRPGEGERRLAERARRKEKVLGAGALGVAGG